LKKFLLGAAACVSLLGLSTANAQDATASFCGTVVKVHASECIVVKPANAGDTTYEVSKAQPKPMLGQMIEGTGTPGDSSSCPAGSTHLTAIRWHPVSTCPAAKSP